MPRYDEYGHEVLPTQEDAPARYDTHGRELMEHEQQRRPPNMSPRPRQSAHAGNRFRQSWCLEGPGDDLIRVRKRPDHLVVVPAVPLIAPGTTSAGLRVEFRTGGRRGMNCQIIQVIGMSGSVRDDTPGAQAAGDYELASIAVQITNQEGMQYVTNGTGADFAAFDTLFRSNPVFDLDIVVPTSEIWFVAFQNLQPAATGHSLTPELTFHCLLPPESR